MNNLNKYTKADLISKIKRLDNTNSNFRSSLFIRIIDNIFYFIRLLLKISLITFIIKWIKRYSLLQKFWHLFRIIASGLLGISLIDIYSLDIITWIKDTQIYKWYLGLFNIHNIEKVEIVEDAIPSFMRETIEIKDGDSESSQRNSKNIEWINRINEQKINDETQPFYYNKYFIIGALSLTALFSWYYFEEIKTGYGTIVDWINSFRPTTPDSSTGTNTSNSTTSTRSTIQERLNKIFKDPEVDITSKKEVNPTKDIELIDNTEKAKGVLTSPSLENLNNKATESWAEGSSSPKSDSSSVTITQSNFIESSKLSDSVSAIPHITANWKNYCLMSSTKM